MRTAAIFNLTLFLAIVGLVTAAFVSIKVDIFFNGQWLTEGLSQWRWWNYLTSEHALTVMYLEGHWWLAPPCMIAFIIASVFALKS